MRLLAGQSPLNSTEMPNDRTTVPPSPLRVALLLDDWTVPRWVAEILRSISGSSHIQLVLVVLSDNSASPSPGSFWTRNWRRLRSLAFKAYQTLDDWRFGRKDDPFKSCDIRALLRDVDCLRVKPIRTAKSDRLAERDLIEIARYRLDVALRFGFRILRGGVLDTARYGVWSFHHGDDREYRGGPPATWEVFEQNPVTGAVVQILTETLDGGRILARVAIATDKRSVRRNRNTLYTRAWRMMPRLLEQLYETRRLEIEPPPFIYDRRLYRTPSNFETFLGVGRVAGRFLVDRFVGAIWREQWRLGYQFSESSVAAYRFKPIKPPRDRFWADPFPVEADGGYVIFFEEFVYPRRGERGKAWISAMRIDAKGAPGPVSKVLEEPHHLSFPFVFSWRDEWYMLPECGDANRVALYKCRRFPDDWKPCAVLVEGIPGRDNTLAEIGGRWWLWVTVQLSGTPNADETLLFHADNPLGPFSPHVRNPVVTDARFARCAGRPFLRDGVWIRPAQDCSIEYGRAIVFRRIDRLDLHEYAESEISRLEPLWSPPIVRAHTYNRAGPLHVIDFKQRYPAWR